MALWSVALFGHYKPKVEGWERRAEPGDIIAFRPISEHGFWTPTERREFLIVTLDDIEIEHLEGLKECHWDTDSYQIPEGLEARLIAEGVHDTILPSRYFKKRRFQITLDDLRDRGVDIDKMLNKELFYNPEIETIKRVKCYDKMKKGYAAKSDKHKLMDLKKIGKLDGPHIMDKIHKAKVK